MTAVTKAQWFEKLKAWVPTWVFADENFQVAVFKGISKLLESVDADIAELLTETFITDAMGDFLDAHGADRGVIRDAGESDDSYAERIRRLKNSPDIVAMETKINTLLVVGVCLMIEHDYAGNFMGVDSFMDRSCILTDIYYDTFTIVIPNQGVGELAVLESIARHVNGVKALGTLYRITETAA